MIPLSIPNLGPAERDAVAAVVEANWVSSAGPDIAQFEKLVAQRCGVRFGVAVSSGTAALHLALLAAGVEPDDIVLAPNLTFVATLNAISYVGATPVLVDADPQHVQMDADLVAHYLEQECEFREGASFEKASGKRVRALLASHVLGYGGAIARLQELARDKGVLLIEDAAEALGSTFQGRPAGSFGLLACLSFNGNKIVTTGGGGMVLTNDAHLADQVRHLSTQAKSFSAEYIHDRIGYNYRMPNLNAAMGIAQMQRLPGFLQRKSEIYQRYQAVFSKISDLHSIAWIPEDQPNHWLVNLFHPAARQLEEFLTIFDIRSRKLWVPMNRLPMYRPCRYLHKADHSHRLYEHSLSLPCSTGLSDEDLETVLQKIQEFFSR